MKKNQLHILIQNLSKSEKRYFHLFSKRSGENESKNYLHLFSTLEKMEHYDEQILVDSLNELDVNTKYLATDKNYLYRSILKSLRSYNTKFSPKQKVREQLDFIEILTEKGLFEQASKILRKTKTLAQSEGAIEYLPELLQIERKIQGTALEFEELDAQYLSVLESLDQIRNVIEYEFFYRKSNLFRIKAGRPKDLRKLEFLDELKGAQYIKKHEPSNFDAERNYLRALAIHHHLRNEVEKELEINKSLVDLMKNKQRYINAYPIEFASIFSRVLILSKKIAPEEYPRLLKEFLKFADDTDKSKKKVKAHVYTLAYGTEMVRLIQLKEYAVGKALIPKVEQVMSQYQKVINPSFCLNNYYRFSYIYIGVQNFGQALESLNILIKNYDSRLRPDIYGYAKILLCICHYELGNAKLVTHFSDAAKYYLQKEGRLFEAEQIFLQGIKVISKSSDQINEFKSLYNKITPSLDMPGAQAQIYFDFKGWLRIKAELA